MRRKVSRKVKPHFAKERGFLSGTDYWGETIYDFIVIKDSLAKVWDKSENSEEHRGKVGLVTKTENFCMGEWVYLELANGKEIEVDYFAIDPTTYWECLLYKINLFFEETYGAKK